MQTTEHPILLQLTTSRHHLSVKSNVFFIRNFNIPQKKHLLIYLPACLPAFLNSCRSLPETKRHSCLFLHWSGSKFLVVMAAYTPSIHIFLGRPLFLLSRGIHPIINFGILSSGISLTWSYHCSLFLSMMSGSPFTPNISFMYIHFLFFPSLIFLLTSLAHPFL